MFKHFKSRAGDLAGRIAVNFYACGHKDIRTAGALAITLETGRLAAGLDDVN